MNSVWVRSGFFDMRRIWRDGSHGTCSLANGIFQLMEWKLDFKLAFSIVIDFIIAKTTRTTQIDDLSDFILVEILARLACKKTVFRAKCVSKRWSSLLSDSYFVRRFLSLQGGVDEGNAFIGAGIVAVLPYPALNKLSRRPELEVLSHPVVKTKEGGYLSLDDFLPFSQQQKQGDAELLLVLGTYNDLVLCRKLTYEGEHYRYIYNCYPYYICNPYTKQWVSIPSNNLRESNCMSTHTGFVCEPYLNYSGDGKKDEASSIILNSEYRWSVVQIHLPFQTPNLEKFHVDIFSSETHQWRHLVVACPPSFISLGTSNSNVVVYNGMLCWLLGCDNTIVKLDPMLSSDECSFDVKGTIRAIMFLGVCRGRLRMCLRDFDSYYFHDPGRRHLRVWELKEEVDENGGKFNKWCLMVSLSMNQLVTKHPLIPENKLRNRRRFRVRCFHPYNEDLVFLETEHPNCISICNMRERTLEVVSEFDPTMINSESWFHGGTYFFGAKIFNPFVIPWLPTPVPKL